MPTVGELMNKQPTISAQKRTNNVIGVLADILKPLSDRADKYALSNSIPLVGGMTVAELTGLKGAQGLLNDVSYGAPVVRGGSFQTAQIDPRVLDVAGLVPTVGGVLKGGGAYGKALAKEVGRNINEGTTIGQMLDPRMNMIAYHGSPHSFDKFSMDKIGTGEGAQAYGHGLYFADSPEVAKSYVNAGLNLKPTISQNMATKKLNNDYSKIYEHEKLNRELGNYDVSSNLLNTITNLVANNKGIDNYAFDLSKKRSKQALTELKVLEYIKNNNELRDVVEKHLKTEGGASFYKVDISDDAIPNMLLWDKPLSEQPKAIQDEIKRIGGSASNGAEAYKELMFQARMEGIKSDKASLRNNVEQLAASKRLKELGIPGIRYLDAGSRGQGAGTMNTVVFDDSLVKILEKNGKPVGAK